MPRFSRQKPSVDASRPEIAIDASDRFPDRAAASERVPARAGARLLLAAVTIALVLGGITHAAAQPTDQERMRRAVDYLLAGQLPSGLFVYDFDFVADRPVEPDNIVRQAGIAYFLAEYYREAPDPHVRRAIEATLSRLGELSLPIGKSRWQSALEQTGILSVPIGRYKLRAALERFGLLYRPSGNGKVISLDGKYVYALTGAMAVALLAEMQYSQATGDNRFGSLRSAWLEGLLSLRIPRRGFRISPGFIDDTPFFDGEGWLALAYYHGVFPRDKRITSVLEDLEAYLMTRYAKDVTTGFYQWGTMAAALRLEQTLDPKFLSFIGSQARTLLEAPRRDEWRGDSSCAHMEGLAVAARVLRAHQAADGLLEKVVARLNEEMEKNRALQIPSNGGRIVFGDGVQLISPRLREFAGAFLVGKFQAYTRVDETGHCVSAMTKLAQLDRSIRAPRP
jgi:hypothetical protein